MTVRQSKRWEKKVPLQERRHFWHLPDEKISSYDHIGDRSIIFYTETIEVRYKCYYMVQLTKLEEAS